MTSEFEKEFNTNFPGGDHLLITSVQFSSFLFLLFGFFDWPVTGSTDIPYADRLDPPHAYTQFNLSSFVDRCVRFEVIEKKEEKKRGTNNNNNNNTKGLCCIRFLISFIVR